MPHRTARRARLLAAVLTVGTLVGLLAAAAPSQAAAPVRGSQDPATGWSGTTAAGSGCSLATGARSGAAASTSAVTAARSHLDRVGRVFGVAARDLRTAGVSRVAGRDVVRFQQTRRGLPVLGGQLVMVLDGRGGLLSVSGETAGPATSTAYDVAASTAARTARRATAAHHGVARRSLRTDRPTRWLLDRSLLDPRATPGLRPVWRVPVRSAARPDLRDLVLVDARTGRVALRLAEVAGLDRVVCDDVRTRSYRCQRDYDRVEGGPATGIVDADQAYDLTGATAAWFGGTLGVDLTALIGSDLGDGRKLRSTTNFCPPGECPLDNAFWSGDQMVFGAGYTSADDVVAHELAHGVIQHTAGLVYWYQSGAINESMADVVGELVDLADGTGSDAPELRWQLGEDLPAAAGGVTRDMADPPRFGQPDTTRSGLYDFAQDYDDNGAVHTNSGVPNKTAYLIADGTAGRARRHVRGPRLPRHRHHPGGDALLGDAADAHPRRGLRRPRRGAAAVLRQPGLQPRGVRHGDGRDRGDRARPVDRPDRAPPGDGDRRPRAGPAVLGPAGVQRVGRPGLLRRRGLAGRQRRPVLHPRAGHHLVADRGPGARRRLHGAAGRGEPERHLAAGDPRPVGQRVRGDRHVVDPVGQADPRRGDAAQRARRGAARPAGPAGPPRRRLVGVPGRPTRPAPTPPAGSRSPGTPGAAAGGSSCTPVRPPRSAPAPRPGTRPCTSG